MKIVAGRIKNFEDEKVIEKALNQFWSSGYKGTSTRNLAEAMGINYGSVYNSFSNKEELYLKSLDYATTNFIQMLENIIYSVDNPIEGLKKLFYQLAAEKDIVIRKRGCFLGNTIIEFSDVNGSIRSKVLVKFKQFEGMFLKALKSAKMKGFLNENMDTGIHAATLLTFFQGFMVYRRSCQDLELMKEIIHLNFTLLEK